MWLVTISQKVNIFPNNSFWSVVSHPWHLQGGSGNLASKLTCSPQVSEAREGTCQNILWSTFIYKIRPVKTGTFSGQTWVNPPGWNSIPWIFSNHLHVPQIVSSKLWFCLAIVFDYKNDNQFKSERSFFIWKLGFKDWLNVTFKSILKLPKLDWFDSRHTDNWENPPSAGNLDMRWVTIVNDPWRSGIE